MGDRDRALFDGIAADWARKDLSPAARIARRCRLLRSLECATLPPSPRILEIGCGAGFAAEYLSGMAGAYVGIDQSERLVTFARRSHVRPEVSFRALDLYALEPDGSFDAVVMIGVLHHLPDLPAALGIALRTLKPGGWLVANEPHPGNPLISLARSVRKRIDPAYSSDQRELPAAELRDALVAAGFSSVELVPQGVLSTPFAEIVLPGQRLLRPLATLACAIDRALEQLPPAVMLRVAWNVVAAGQRPG